mmetsp:Transcript_36189/g.76167  ORF Transcript_36189/g.76167 Transcript_36189/m.76167 type:complete len:216 (-) Transcript_36189:118-765(-)
MTVTTTMLRSPLLGPVIMKLLPSELMVMNALLSSLEMPALEVGMRHSRKVSITLMRFSRVEHIMTQHRPFASGRASATRVRSAKTPQAGWTSTVTGVWPTRRTATVPAEMSYTTGSNRAPSMIRIYTAASVAVAPPQAGRRAEAPARILPAGSTPTDTAATSTCPTDTAQAGMCCTSTSPRTGSTIRIRTAACAVNSGKAQSSRYCGGTGSAPVE